MEEPEPRSLLVLVTRLCRIPMAPEASENPLLMGTSLCHVQGAGCDPALVSQSSTVPFQ